MIKSLTKKIIIKLYTYYVNEIYLPEEFMITGISLIVNEGATKHLVSNPLKTKSDILLLIDVLKDDVSKFVFDDEKIDKFMCILNK